jgi:hypothetical protein
MLYDPEWGTPSLAGFIAFAETKNPSETYNWNSPRNCAVAQYKTYLTGDMEGWSRDGRYVRLNALAFQARTFGELARIARQYFGVG